jgi:hypothetical protein
MLSVKTDRQMAAARAEQSEQRERDECEFHQWIHMITAVEYRAWAEESFALIAVNGVSAAILYSRTD